MVSIIHILVFIAGLLTVILTFFSALSTFVLPRAVPIRFVAGQESPSGMETSEYYRTGLRHVRLRPIPSTLVPYTPGESYGAAHWRHARTQASSATLEAPEGHRAIYGPDIRAEVQRYAIQVMKVAESEEFDVVHAHDWMTFPAGIAVATVTGKPLVVQVHSTEFDRSGEHVNQYVYDIERQGMHAAAAVIDIGSIRLI